MTSSSVVCWETGIFPIGIIGVSFYAWTDHAGLFRKFGVGNANAGDVVSEVLAGVDGINGQQEVPMATEPTLYFIELATSPTELSGGFRWAGGVSVESTLFVAGVEFVAERPMGALGN